MKVTVLGCKRVQGIAGARSANPGREFDLAKLFVIESVEAVHREGLSIHGYGFEVQEYELEPGAEESFKGLKFPATVELSFKHKPFAGRINVVVTGCRAAA